MTTQEILSDLNEDQREVVKDYTGARFVVAGPGAGKTHTIISMAQYMIKKGVSAKKIMMFTFTNKAAKEIKNRVVSKIGDEGADITVGTYHSICVRFLRKHADKVGFSKKFTIFDQEDSLSIIKKICKGSAFDHYKVAEYISDCKNRMITPSRAIQNAQGTSAQLAEFYRLYQNELFSQNAMDFDDLIFFTILLFERCPDILAQVNEQYQYIIADEFHDSCQRDIRFIELLAGTRKNVCMILDDEQSIYSFRGADLDAVLSVQSKFEGLKTYVLHRNYRSTKMIVNASRSLIKNNKDQIDKTIFTMNDEGTQVLFFEEYDQNNEALRVLKLVSLLVKKYNMKYKDIAILYRMSYLSRSIEDKLLVGGIPYKIIGGTPFYSRKEIKDILCYARLLYNPFDFEAFKRVINTPKRGLGEVAVEKIYQHARNSASKPMDFIQACKTFPSKGKQKEGLDQFNKIIAFLETHYETDTPTEFVERIINKIDYRAMIIETEPATIAEDRIANLAELQALASSFSTMEEFIQNTSLDTSDENDDEDDDNKVQLLTMHSSKGLEWPAVIIVDAVDGINPHWRSTGEPKKLEEERRLFYVAMTRAQKYLFITRPKSMIQNGMPQSTIESRFIREIDTKYLKRYKPT